MEKLFLFEKPFPKFELLEVVYFKKPAEFGTMVPCIIKNVSVPFLYPADIDNKISYDILEISFLEEPIKTIGSSICYKESELLTFEEAIYFINKFYEENKECYNQDYIKFIKEKSTKIILKHLELQTKQLLKS